MKKISLKDIAAAVGVAPSTVSFVLNGKGKQMRISDALAEKVRAVAEKAGYHPNKIAVSLRTGTSKILGLIVEDISNNFFASLAKIIELEAEKFGYNVVFCSTENDTRKGKQLLKILNQQQVDGYLVTPTVGMCDDLELLHQQKQPMILMDRYFPELKVSSVLADNSDGVTKAMEHLLKQGYSNIGFITVDLDLVQMKQREVAYIQSLEHNKMSSDAACILKVPVNTPQESAVQMIEDFIRKNEELDALFFATNYLGIAGLESLRNLDVKIPKDKAVICFDDHDIFRLYSPGITTVCQPIEKIGSTAVQLLVDKINQSPRVEDVNVVTLSTTLVVRGSTTEKTGQVV